MSEAPAAAVRSEPPVSGHTLLFELGTEELPAKPLPVLGRHLHDTLVKSLVEASLAPAGATRWFATPRRLAVLLEGLPARQPDRESLRRGPAIAAAFDAQGAPTPAARGFARSVGVDVGELERIETDKGAWLGMRLHQDGQPVANLLPGMISRAVENLPLPKRMRWADQSHEFLRPVHWLVAMLDDQVLAMTVLGLSAEANTRGHRFHAPEPLPLETASDYEFQLAERGRVVASFEQRRSTIQTQVERVAREAGGEPVIDEDLLDEVTGLVEWPEAMVGRFDERFLEVPQEALISTMQDNQKYFPVVDGAGQLMPYFVLVANISSREPSQVRQGNERVIRPRFADAKFFWDQDRRRPLASRVAELETVVFQERLGTLRAKADRVQRLAVAIASLTGADSERVRRGALLAKCDLMTEMVGEFPELQGIMGRYYAAHDGEPDDVAAAMDEQYWPRQAGGVLPETGVGQALSLADKLDTLAGIFAIGQRPTGVKDPFGLRRAAIGALRILIERELDLDLAPIVGDALAGLPKGFETDGVASELLDYMLERLKAYYSEQGIPVDAFEAVRTLGVTRPLDMHRRLEAVQAFRQLPAADSLTAANKRIANILRKAPAGTDLDQGVDASLLHDEAERDLFAGLQATRAATADALDQGDYRAVLTHLAELRQPVDRFFDEVMVMAEDPQLQQNRLSLLRALQAEFLKVADIARLQG